MSSLRCSFEAVAEDRPGPRWQRRFTHHWPAYRAWYLRGGVSGRPTYLECRRALRTYLPNWLTVWEQLIELAGGGDLEARFLSMWSPPAYIAGCSQAVWQGDGGPLLVRNYDYAPALLEGSWLATRWTGQRVVAVSDCLTGALDGINESGLAVSLSFGGRPEVGAGFGIPLVVRWLLEFCESTAHAVHELARIPQHMSYSVTMLDRRGEAVVAFVAPDRPLEILPPVAVTNHQHRVEWIEHARATASLERQQALQAAIDAAADADDLVQSLLTPPLYQRAWGHGHGTLYTAVYAPQRLTAELVWPMRRWQQSVLRFRAGTFRTAYATGDAPHDH